MCAFYPIYLQPEDVPSEIFEEDFPVMPWRTYDSYEENCDEDFLEPMMNKAGLAGGEICFNTAFSEDSHLPQRDDGE